ncbi:hypothetical protein CY34DRAFT_98838, partial [Suillus luteus UH-Slu-Lm8-n1]
QFPCRHPGCKKYFKSLSGRTRHCTAMHPFMSRETTKGAGSQDMDIDGESRTCPTQ